jgi:hypothetical protein
MTVKINKPAVNLREELNELKKPTGVAGEAMLRAETPQEQFNLIGAGRRNIIINGDFQVSQRGDYSSASNLVESTYFVDRWRTRNSNSMTATKAHSTRKVALNQTSAGTGSIRIDQKIEIIDNEQYTDKYMTLSADIKSNDSNARMGVYHQGWDPKNTQHSGGGGWERLTLTFWTGTLVTGNEFSIQLGIDGDSSADVSIAAGAYVEIKNVQLEFGKVATPFEHRSYGEELALCERYYQKSYDKDAYVTGSTSLSTVGSVDHYGSSDATNVLAQVYFRTQMRDAPTVTTYDPNSSNGGNAYAGRAYVASNSGTASYNTTTNNIGSTGFRSYVPKNGAGWAAHRIIFQWQAVAEL